MGMMSEKKDEKSHDYFVQIGCTSLMYFCITK